MHLGETRQLGLSITKTSTQLEFPLPAIRALFLGQLSHLGGLAISQHSNYQYVRLNDCRWHNMLYFSLFPLSLCIFVFLSPRCNFQFEPPFYLLTTKLRKSIWRIKQNDSRRPKCNSGPAKWKMAPLRRRNMPFGPNCKTKFVSLGDKVHVEGWTSRLWFGFILQPCYRWLSR